jgi:D-lactate dehydrogenase
MDAPRAFLAALAGHFPADRLHTDPAGRHAYGYDNSRGQAQPGAVLFPLAHAEVALALTLAHQHRVPVTARGRGTATTGAAVPSPGGLVLALERMDRIIELRPDDRLAVVEAGCLNGALQTALQPHGLMWPPDPTSAPYSTVGGNLACNAGGPRTVKYGASRDNVLGLRAVLGDGREVRTGVRTTKSAMGYDLTRLLVGSEGTLAVITEATLELQPRPGATRTLRAVYRDAAAAGRAVAAVMRQPVVPTMLEFMDGAALALVQDQVALPDGAGALLLCEVDGSQEALEVAVEAVSAALADPGLMELRAARDAGEAGRLWAARKALSPALRGVAPDKINEDVVVPVSRLPELVTGLHAIGARHAIKVVAFGHAGNGNLHANLMHDASDPVQAAAAAHALQDLFALVLGLGGTLSGEHGIGTAKRELLARALDPVELELMRALKRSFDPAGILNPGKLLTAI